MYGKLLHTWDQTSNIWAIIANTHNDWEKNPRGNMPYDIHPLRMEQGVTPTGSDNSVGFWSRIKLIQGLPEKSQSLALAALMGEKHGS